MKISRTLAALGAGALLLTACDASPTPAKSAAATSNVSASSATSTVNTAALKLAAQLKARRVAAAKKAAELKVKKAAAKKVAAAKLAHDRKVKAERAAAKKAAQERAVRVAKEAAAKAAAHRRWMATCSSKPTSLTGIRQCSQSEIQANTRRYIATHPQYEACGQTGAVCLKPKAAPVAAAPALRTVIHDPNGWTFIAGCGEYPPRSKLPDPASCK